MIVLQISNSILYNFYFLQINHIFTLKGLNKNDFRNKQQADPDPNHDPQLNGESDLKNLTTLQIANSILYNIYLCKYALFLLLMVLNYKKKIFLWSSGRVGSKSWSIDQFFFIIMIFHRRKVILHLNSLLAKKCPLFSKSMFQFFYFAKMQKKTGTLDKPDPMPGVIEH